MNAAPTIQHPKKTEKVENMRSVSRGTVELKESGRTPQNGRRADGLAELVERERRDDGARLSARGGHAVCGSPELGREHFGGIAVCCSVNAGSDGLLRRAKGNCLRVGTKIEEELTKAKTSVR